MISFGKPINAWFWSRLENLLTPDFDLVWKTYYRLLLISFGKPITACFWSRLENFFWQSIYHLNRVLGAWSYWSHFILYDVAACSGTLSVFFPLKYTVKFEIFFKNPVVSIFFQNYGFTYLFLSPQNKKNVNYFPFSPKIKKKERFWLLYLNLNICYYVWLL